MSSFPEIFAFSKYRHQRKLIEQTVCYDLNDEDRVVLETSLKYDKYGRYFIRGLIPLLFLYRVPHYAKYGLSPKKGTLIFGFCVASFLLSDAVSSSLIWRKCSPIVNQYAGVSTAKVSAREQRQKKDQAIRRRLKMGRELQDKEAGSRDILLGGSGRGK